MHQNLKEGYVRNRVHGGTRSHMLEITYGLAVVFETGFRKRDPAYDGGDKYWGPRW